MLQEYYFSCALVPSACRFNSIMIHCGLAAARIKLFRILVFAVHPEYHPTVTPFADERAPVLR